MIKCRPATPDDLAAVAQVFFAAFADSVGQAVGYILAAIDVTRLRRAAFWPGHWLRVLRRALTGQYDLGWRTLRTVRGDKLAFLRGTRLCDAHRARLVSLAVAPDYQGRGIGRQLVSAGLEYLRGRRAQTIRIGVRPDNAPALHLYEAFGFHMCGEHYDSQGKWVIMVKENGEV